MKLFDKYKIPYKFIHTCQHYEIIEKNRERFNVKKPDVYLTMKKDDLRNIWEFLVWAPQVLWSARRLPITSRDYVIIHGDAESTLLGFLIGKFYRAKLVHVESGYRSGNLLEPFPEELVRSIVDRFSDICFTPYKDYVKHIKKKNGVYVTNGNTVFDSVKWALQVKPSSKIKSFMTSHYVPFLIHRKENLFKRRRIQAILDILEMILRKKLKVIWPIHTNTRYELKAKGSWERLLKLQSQYDLELDYFFDYVDFMHLVKYSEFVASDGGGLQKETYFLNKPMLILRKATEVEPGVGETAFLSYLDKKKVAYFLKHYKKMVRKSKLKGSPSEIIVDYLTSMSEQNKVNRYLQTSKNN